MDNYNHYFRELGNLPPVATLGQLSSDSGYFTFGNGIVCYGRTSRGYRKRKPTDVLYDVSEDVSYDAGRVLVPFDPAEVVTNLSHERYFTNGVGLFTNLLRRAIRQSYYAARPHLPLGLRSNIQKYYLRDWQSLEFPKWPVDTTIDQLRKKLLANQMRAAGITTLPFIWFWPEGAGGCVIMTHDVEEEKGRKFCSTLMDVNDEYGIPASFQIVPERRYTVTADFIEEIKSRGYEVGVQDLYHDGRLYWERSEFERRAQQINEYGRQYGAKGFRAAILYRNQEWFDMLEFEYDMSVPNVAHLDPQRGGCCTVMPYFNGQILELPVTTTQDHSMFHILRDYSLKLWSEQIELILAQNGLVSFIIHPDYIVEKAAMQVYTNLLEGLRLLRNERNVWIARPDEVNRWWRHRAKMTLEQQNGQWSIKGADRERARIAFAHLNGDSVVYRFDKQSPLALSISNTDACLS